MIRGDSGNNQLYGTGSTDSIYGLGGDDRLFGRASADRLDGGSGRDGLYGGSGNDELLGGTGNDLLHGGGGNDHLVGGAGIDTANYADESVGIFADFYLGTVGTGMRATSATDRIESIERIYGGSGSDFISGAASDDAGGRSGIDFSIAVFGKAGDDIIIAGLGNDYLTGDEGNDLLAGDFGNDRLFGGDGNDLLSAAEGRDVLTGGQGSDRFDVSVEIPSDPSLPSFRAGQSIVLDFDQGQDLISMFVKIEKGADIDLDIKEMFHLLDSNRDDRLTTADLWVDVEAIGPDGMAAKASLVIDFGNSTSPAVLGAGHTLTLYGVTSLVESDFGTV